MQRQIYDKVELILNDIMREYTDLLTYLMNKENTRQIFGDLYRDKFVYISRAYLELTNESPKIEGELVDLVQGISKRLYLTNMGWQPKNDDVTYQFMTWVLSPQNANILKDKYLMMMRKIYSIDEIKNSFSKEINFRNKKGSCFPTN